MHEIMRTNDIVASNFAQVVLAEAGLHCVVMDAHISAMEGGIGAFPCRLMVLAEDAEDAARALRDAGLGEWLVS
jgi:hypothetical protein